MSIVCYPQTTFLEINYCYLWTILGIGLERNYRSAIGNKQIWRARRFKILGELVELLEQFPNYLAEGDPQEINQKLRVIIDKVIIAENKEIRIQFK